MTAVRRWLSRPALTYGQLVLIIAAVGVANGIQALTGISDTVTVLVVVGLVIAGHMAWALTHRMLQHKARQ